MARKWAAATFLPKSFMRLMITMIRTFPRITATMFGLFVVLIACAGTELYCRLQLARTQTTQTAAPREESSAPFTEKDPRYGYRLLPNADTHNKRFEGSTLAYEGHYTTDACRRRTTPNPNPERRKKFIAFLGCSMTFGVGVNDDETFAACLARKTDHWYVYNYAAPGYGPQNTLVLFEDGKLPQEISQQEGIFVFNFIDAHVRRVIGNMRSFFWWTKDLPCYGSVHGKLTHLGTFEHARPCYNRFLALMNECATWKYFKLDWPPFVTGSHIRLTADIINEAARLSKQQFPHSQFYVHIMPISGLYGERLCVFLDKDIHIIDNRDFKRPKDEIYYSDWHFNKRGNQMMAELLARQLPLSLDGPSEPPE